MFRVILQTSLFFALVACASVSENSVSSPQLKKTAPNPFDAIVEKSVRGWRVLCAERNGGFGRTRVKLLTWCARLNGKK